MEEEFTGCSYPNVLAPDDGVCHGVPEVAGAVVASREELVVAGVRCQTPQLLSVALGTPGVSVQVR